MQDTKESFEIVLNGMRDTKPETLVAQIHRVFGTIRTLNVDEVITAHQTLSFITSNSSDIQLHMQIGKIKEALSFRMDDLIQGATRLSVDDGVMLRKRFRVLG